MFRRGLVLAALLGLLSGIAHAAPLAVVAKSRFTVHGASATIMLSGGGARELAHQLVEGRAFRSAFVRPAYWGRGKFVVKASGTSSQVGPLVEAAGQLGTHLSAK